MDRLIVHTIICKVVRCKPAANYFRSGRMFEIIVFCNFVVNVTLNFIILTSASFSPCYASVGDCFSDAISLSACELVFISKDLL